MFLFKRYQAFEEEIKSLKLKILEFETKEKIENDEENKSLKLKIIELTQELEKKEERENNCVCFERQDEQINLRERPRRAVAEDDMMRTEEIPVTIHSLQMEGTHEKIRMSGSVMSVSSEGVDSPFQDILVEEEPNDEFFPEDLPHDTQSMDEDSIDTREDDIGYGVSNSRSDKNNSIQESVLLGSLNDDQSSQIPIKFVRDLDGSANTEPDSADGTELDLNHGSENKKAKVKRKERKKVHPPKAPHNCSFCNKSFLTDRLLTIHKKTHVGEIDMELPTKRSLPVENEEMNASGPPEKKRKVVCETEVRIDEEMPGIREDGIGIVPPSVDESNPFTHKDSEEFLKRILSNLGKKDLLNARLISRAWNDKSLEMLRKSKFTQVLRDWKMERYILFAESNEAHQLILPFHLDFRISSYPMYLARYNRILTTQVERLTKMFTSNCVSTLTLSTEASGWTEENIQEIGLTKCLEFISPGLKTLDLKSFDVGIDFLQNQMISFPNLDKLICGEFESGRRGAGLTYKTIIDNSPNLEDLALRDPRDLVSWPLTPLKSLSIDCMFRPQKILQILSSSGAPVLRELSFGYGEYWSAEDKTVVYNILKSVSTSLKSLIFHGHGWFPPNRGSLRLPELPELKRLGLEYDIGKTSQPLAENLDFSPETFPSLKSIELPLGFIFTPTPIQSEDDGDGGIEFPNLNKLILRVSAKARPEHVDKPLEQLQLIFPTPAKLCLVNVRGKNDVVKYVLYRIMKSNWYKSIQQIEMIGFFKYYLGGIVDGLELSPPDHSEKWYWMLEESMKTEYQNTMKRIRMEFEVTVVDDPDSIVLRRANQ